MRRVLLTTTAVMAAQATQGSAQRPFSGHWHESRSTAVDRSEVLPVTLALKRRNMQQLETLLYTISDPRSKAYGNKMSPEAIRALISPGAAQIAAVSAWLKEHGVEKFQVAAHEDYIKMEATVEQLEAMFGIQFKTYRSHDGETLTRSLDRLVIPEQFADVISLAYGVADLPERTPKRVRRTGTDPSGAERKVSPQVLYDTYNMTADNQPSPIAGQRNIQSFYQNGESTTLSDLTAFCNQFLPSVAKERCTIEEFEDQPNNPPPAGNGESNLDSQYILATSNGAETWTYSFSGRKYSFCGSWARFSQDIFSESTHPNVVSISYGAQIAKLDVCTPEEIQTVEDDWKKLGAMGVTVIIASGDDGTSYSGRSGYQGQILYASWPASSPYATAVGATSFVNPTGPLQQAVQFPGVQGGWSGGGFAWAEDAPDFQAQTIDNYVKKGNGLAPLACWPSNLTKRGTPDLSFLGANFQLYINGQLEEEDGTSASAPSFAGIVTQLNWERMKDGGKTLGWLNPLIYQHPEVFTDITAGNNDNNNNGFGFEAVEGWDAATGLGVPNFGLMVDLVKSINNNEIKAEEGWKAPAPKTKQQRVVAAAGSTKIPVAGVWATSANGELLVVQAPGEQFDVYKVNSDATATKINSFNGEYQDCTGTNDATKPIFCVHGVGYQEANPAGVTVAAVGADGSMTVVGTFKHTAPDGYRDINLAQFYYAGDSNSPRANAACMTWPYIKEPEDIQYFGWQAQCMAPDGTVILDKFVDAPTREYGDTGIYANPPTFTFSPKGTAAFATHTFINQVNFRYRVWQTTDGCRTTNVPISAIGNTGSYVIPTKVYNSSCQIVKSGEGLIGFANANEILIVGFDKTNGWSLGAVDATGTAVVPSNIIAAPSNDVFDNVQPVVFGIPQTTTGNGIYVVNVQGNQFLVSQQNGAFNVTYDLGKVPTAPTSFGTTIYPYHGLYDSLVVVGNKNTLVLPNTQGGLTYNAVHGSLTLANQYQETAMRRVRQGPNCVLYEVAQEGAITISAEFAPAPSP